MVTGFKSGDYFFLLLLLLLFLILILIHSSSLAYDDFLDGINIAFEFKTLNREP